MHSKPANASGRDHPAKATGADDTHFLGSLLAVYTSTKRVDRPHSLAKPPTEAPSRSSDSTVATIKQDSDRKRDWLRPKPAIM